MKFKSGKLWGVPRFSLHGAGWLIDWFDGQGTLEGCTVPNSQELDWIKANPAEVEAMRERFTTWRKSGNWAV